MSSMDFCFLSIMHGSYLLIYMIDKQALHFSGWAMFRNEHENNELTLTCVV